MVNFYLLCRNKIITFRFEVFKFSLSGMDKADQMEARVAQAIKLGAKPGKKPCLPYSELKAKIKVEKDASKHQKVSFCFN